MSRSGKAPWFGLALLLITCLLCSGTMFWLYEVAKNLKQSIVRVNSADGKLQEAAKIAKASLDVQFVARLQHSEKGDRFAIKGKFISPVGPEYLWLKDPQIVPGGFKGILDQKPIAFPAHKGDAETVKKSDVYDWLIERADGSRAGGFTEIALSPKDGGRASR